jgi:hypothetical protein
MLAQQIFENNPNIKFGENLTNRSIANTKLEIDRQTDASGLHRGIFHIVNKPKRGGGSTIHNTPSFLVCCKHMETRMKLYNFTTNGDVGKMGTKGMFIFSQIFFLQKQMEKKSL